MVAVFAARLEHPDGRIIAPDPAWTPQRQFLWDVVHDTRGLLREDSFADDLALIRRIDASGGQGGPAFALDPAAVLRVYEKVYARAREHATHGPQFRLVASRGSDDWAAVQFFEDEAREFALVGGWTGPLLRTIAPEPDQQSLPNEDRVQVGSREFQIRSVPFADYFREDFESLFVLLRRARDEDLKVRFVQR